MSAAVVMTQTAALAIARLARRYGHQADGPGARAVSVACPQCHQRVAAVREPRRASRGPMYESAARALDRAMLAHLLEGWCGS